MSSPNLGTCCPKPRRAWESEADSMDVFRCRLLRSRSIPQSGKAWRDRGIDHPGLHWSLGESAGRSFGCFSCARPGACHKAPSIAHFTHKERRNVMPQSRSSLEGMYGTSGSPEQWTKQRRPVISGGPRAPRRRLDPHSLPAGRDCVKASLEVGCFGLSRRQAADEKSGSCLKDFSNLPGSF